jgi:hypothetical protein
MSKLQALMQQVLCEIPQETSILAQLCHVEIMALWITQLSAQQQEDVCDRQNAESNLQAQPHPYKQAASAFASILLPCMVRVRFHCRRIAHHASQDTQW